MDRRTSSSSTLRFGGIQLDLRSGELRNGRRRITLQEQPCQILAALLERPGEVVTREELCQKLWPTGTFVDFEHSLNSAITRLRQALRESCEDLEFIETLPRRGYRFNLEIEASLMSNPAPASGVEAKVFEDCLKGRYYWNRRSEEGLTKAIRYFEQATVSDPRYAPAYAGLADSHIIRSTNFGTTPFVDSAPRARAAALKALEIDPGIAEISATLATVAFAYDWDWNAASEAFVRAVELDPHNACIQQRYSLYLMAAGLAEESISRIMRAREMDCLSISINFSLGRRLYMARQYDRAIEQLLNTLEMDPGYELARCVLGQAYEQKGDYDRAIAELKHAAAISRKTPLVIAALGHAYAVAGRRKDAETLLEQLIGRSQERYISPFYISLVYSGLGQQEQAMNWLESAYYDRSNGLVFVKVDPQLDALRGNQRFMNLQRKMGLPN